MKEKKTYPWWIRFAIDVVRPFRGQRTLVGQAPPGPCVYLARHRDTDGVVDAFTSLPVVVRPLVLYVFTSYAQAKKQLKEYTLSVRMKKGKVFCAIASPIWARVLTALVRSLSGSCTSATMGTA